MRHIFEVVPHTKDAVGVQTIFCQKGIKQGKGENSQVVVIAWCSPYASRKRNYQLERFKTCISEVLCTDTFR